MPADEFPTFCTPPENASEWQKRISQSEAELIALARDCSREELKEELMSLLAFYIHVKKPAAVEYYLLWLIRLSGNLEERAGYYLKLGALMEQGNDFERAVQFYSQALSLEPVDRRTWYLINNNLGYCMNHFNRYDEGEDYCRAAIRVDPRRHNAYKNLGISLEGQGCYAEAARNYIAATLIHPLDRRAFERLQNLYVQHIGISAEIPDISEQIEACRKAVEAARRR